MGVIYLYISTRRFLMVSNKLGTIKKLLFCTFLLVLRMLWILIVLFDTFILLVGFLQYKVRESM